jgi:predicted nucleotidyltransferase
VDASEVQSRLETLAKGVTTTDAALCVFGSLARKEWTAKSDIDWTLLIGLVEKAGREALA